MRLNLKNIELYIGFELVLALTAVLLTDKSNRIICCIFAAGAHELGHIAVMLTQKIRLKSVSLRLFDVLIKSDEPKTVLSDVLITLGGPLANLIFGFAFLPFSLRLSVSQLALCVFNLLPVVSLDGGHLLSLLLLRFLPQNRCEQILRLTTFLFILPLMSGGIYLLLQSGYNYSLLAVSLYLLAILLLKK